MGAYTYEINIPDVRYRISNEYLECKSKRFNDETECKMNVLIKYYSHNMGHCWGPSQLILI